MHNNHTKQNSNFTHYSDYILIMAMITLFYFFITNTVNTAFAINHPYVTTNIIEPIQNDKCNLSDNLKERCIILEINIKKGWSIYSYKAPDPNAALNVALEKNYSKYVDNIDVQYPEDILKIDNIFGEKIENYIYENGVKQILITAHLNDNYNTNNNINNDVNTNLEEFDKITSPYITLKVNYVVCGEDTCMPINSVIKYKLKINTEATSNKKNKKSTYINLLYILFTAFIGGLILNIMPCVLPILSMKILHFIKYSRMDKKEIVKNFSFIIFGIIISFFFLAIFTLILKNWGRTIGWGLHFQEPSFIIFLICVCAILVINLVYKFTIHVPTSILSWLHNIKFNSEYANSLISGMLLVLLATPCTAPFLGTAIAFALSQDTKTIFAIYLFIALGMSTPYFVIALSPTTLSFLPKSGQWIVVVKKILSLPLIGTIIWLMYILKQQIGLSSIIIFNVMLFISIVLILIYNKHNKHNNNHNHKLKNKRIIIYVLLITFSTIFIIPYCFNYSKYENSWFKNIINNITDNNLTQKLLWNDFNKEFIVENLKNNHIVFVNVTADWCLTCKMNEIMLMKSSNFAKFVNDYNVVLVKADYTKRSDDIAEYLSENDKYAIPMNVIYYSRLDNKVILSEIPNMKEILESVKKIREMYTSKK